MTVSQLFLFFLFFFDDFYSVDVTDWIFCIMYLNWYLSDVFLMISLGLYIFWSKITEVKGHSYHLFFFLSPYFSISWYLSIYFSMCMCTQDWGSEEIFRFLNEASSVPHTRRLTPLLWWSDVVLVCRVVWAGGRVPRLGHLWQTLRIDHHPSNKAQGHGHWAFPLQLGWFKKTQQTRGLSPSRCHSNSRVLIETQEKRNWNKKFDFNWFSCYPGG